MGFQIVGGLEVHPQNRNQPKVMQYQHFLQTFIQAGHGGAVNLSQFLRARPGQLRPWIYVASCRPVAIADAKPPAASSGDATPCSHACVTHTIGVLPGLRTPPGTALHNPLALPTTKSRPATNTSKTSCSQNEIKACIRATVVRSPRQTIHGLGSTPSSLSPYRAAAPRLGFPRSGLFLISRHR